MEITRECCWLSQENIETLSSVNIVFITLTNYWVGVNLHICGALLEALLEACSFSPDVSPMSFGNMNSSREGRVLRKYFSSLCRAITDPSQLAEELHAEGIIPVEVSHELKVQYEDNGRESPSTKRQQAAVKMLSAVDQAIATDASRMATLIQVLKDCLNDNGRAAEAVRTMEIEYGGGVDEDFVSIQHARTVMVKHMNNIAAVITDAGRIADMLCDQGIISQRSLDDIKKILPDNGNSDKTVIASVSQLLTSIESQVNLDPGKFPVLIAVLKDDPSTAQDVVALLEAEYCKYVIYD